jgi:O-antigen ligase
MVPTVSPQLTRRTAGLFSFGAFLLALLMAPLDFGSTRTIPYHLLVLLVAAAGCAWALADALGAGAEAFPWGMILGGGLVATAVLTWETWLPYPTLPEFTARHFHRIAARWPHSIVPTDKSWLSAWCATAALACLALYRPSCDESRRGTIALVMVATGAAVAVLGLLQNATHARGIYWDRSARMPGAFFGTFYHHTSAGAYLNSVWPLAAALAIRGLRSSRARERQVGMIAAFSAFIILGAHAGHISRFPQVVAALAMAGSILWLRPWRFASRIAGIAPKWLALGVAGIGLAAGAAVLGGRVGDIHSRWSLLRLSELTGAGPASAPVPPAEWASRMRPDLFIPSDHGNYFLGDRGAAYQTAASAIAERPWFGWGPAGWMAAAAANTVDPFIRTFFQMLQFTHEDYLQVVVEWGLVGAAGWGLLILGSVARCVFLLGSRPERDLIGAGAAVGLAAVLVQSLIDFPLQIPALQMNAVALAALCWSARPQSVSGSLQAL